MVGEETRRLIRGVARERGPTKQILSRRYQWIAIRAEYDDEDRDLGEEMRGRGRKASLAWLFW